MLRNYTTAETLAGYVPHLNNLQWTNQDDYSEQIKIADYEVRNDLFNRGLRSVYLRPDLDFFSGSDTFTSAETTDSVTDSLSRNRWVVDVLAISGGDKTITLEGSNDNETFETVSSATLTEVDEVSYFLPRNYAYYRVSLAVSAGSMTLRSYLTETNYDCLFDYKTLTIILRPLIKSEGDQFDLAYREFQRMYNDMINTMKVHYDTDLDGAVESGEVVKNTIVNYYK